MRSQLPRRESPRKEGVMGGSDVVECLSDRGSGSERDLATKMNLVERQGVDRLWNRVPGARGEGCESSVGK